MAYADAKIRIRLGDTIKGVKFPVLDHGYVILTDFMGSEEDVASAARTSYGHEDKRQRHLDALAKLFPNQQAGTYSDPSGEPLYSPDQLKVAAEYMVKEDQKLIRYLLRHSHTTPFEMVELKFIIQCPMDCWRQWIRHRTASVNEYSTRYSEAIDLMQSTPDDEWRLQATDNKQGSAGTLTEWPEGWRYDSTTQTVHGPANFWLTTAAEDLSTPGKLLSYLEGCDQDRQLTAYRLRLELGVAKEQARKDLPLSTYTRAFWKINLHNLLHFLSLRMDSHAQKEIREYATTIGEMIVAKLFPNIWQAFNDYNFRRNAILLTGPEVEVLKQAFAIVSYAEDDGTLSEYFSNKREAAEFLSKLKRLGFDA